MGLVTTRTHLFKFKIGDLAAAPQSIAIPGTKPDDDEDEGDDDDIDERDEADDDDGDTKAVAVATHPAFGTLFLATKDSLLLYDRAGQLVRQLDLKRFALTHPRTLAYDVVGGGVWVGGQRTLLHLTTNGEFVASVALDKHADAIGVTPFLLRPTLSPLSPPDNSLTNNPRPLVRLGLGASTNGMPRTLDDAYLQSLTLDVTLDAVQVGPLFSIVAPEAQFMPAAPLSDGTHRLLSKATDTFGHASDIYLTRLTVDTIPPRFIELEPQDGAVFAASAATITGKVDDAGANVALLDKAGNGLGLHAANFSFVVTLKEGENHFTLIARDPAGNETRQPLKLVRSTLPPNPATVAPPLDKTVATVLSNATAFLYTGANLIQTGVAPGTIEAKRAAVVRGKVLTRDNAPLTGVAITILGHPELGQTQSRNDGAFDLAVNGGGVMTVNYAKAGYLPAQRQVHTPWQDYVHAPDVALIPLDAEVTRVQTNAATIQVARGSVSTDADGTRRSTILFPAGTMATMTLPDGTTRALTTLDVRATEYTVGANGPKAMPASLPSTSGYTYAVELSVDEAIAANAKKIAFNQPVIQYVENFLNFPVGGIVPAGYYDREKAAWIPAPNGRVIKILTIAGGSAWIDIDGSGTAASSTALAAFGVTTAEQQQLASLYRAGATLWRVPVDHFTPWDYNWPYGPPEDATDPRQPEPEKDDQEDDPCKQTGSIIECQNQVLGERIDIAGTPYSLSYRSNRVAGRKASHTMSIRVSGASVPASLRRIVLEIAIAGRQFTRSFAAAPNQSYVFTWDGLDAYGRPVNGAALASIRIGYVYPAVYYTPAQFAQSFALAGSRIGGNRGRMEITLWQEIRDVLEGVWDPRAQSLGGWSLTPHHRYSSVAGVLYLGEGGRRSAKEGASLVSTRVAGLGPGYSSIGDGGPATQAALTYPNGLAVSPDGSLYIAEAQGRIRHVSPDGTITTIATIGRGYPKIALGPDRVLYSTDGGREHRIVRVSLNDGVITTVAGTGEAGFSGDGGLATEAKLFEPSAVAAGLDGSLYVADKNNFRIRRISPDGVISTIAGTGQFGFGGDGGPATQAMLEKVRDLAIGIDGSLFLAGGNRIRRISPEGTISTIAGTGQYGFNGDGGPAIRANVDSPQGLVVDANGIVYIAELNRIRRISPDGTISTLAGGCKWGCAYTDGAPATQTRVSQPYDVAIHPDGSLYLSLYHGFRVLKLSSSFPQFLGDSLVSSEDGKELYIFSPQGRHLRTLNSQTGARVNDLSYNDEGLLIAITDGDGNITTIERDAAGQPTALIAPDGQRTVLRVDANGYLARVTNPANETYAMTYTADGLLTSFANPRGYAARMTYDALGRLTKDENPAGGSWSLARNDVTGGYEAQMTSALNRTTRYRVQALAIGDRQWLNTYPNGTTTQSVFKTDGTTRITAADGTTTTSVDGPDPRFGMQAPIEKTLTIRLPSGLAQHVIRTRHATLADPNDRLRLQTQTDTVTVDAKSTTNVYTAATQQHVTTSPTGRNTRGTVDAQGRPTQIEIPGLNPITYGYDPRGRLTTLTQGTGTDTRTTTLSYNPQGFIASTTDAANRTQTFTYDAAGRLTTQTLPDGRTITWSYDANGNIIGLTPPGRPAHGFSYTPVDLEDQYTPPALTGITNPRTAYAYNLDKQLTAVTRPDGQVVNLAYDTGGRLSTITTPNRTLTYGYAATTGQLVSLNTSDSQTLSYTHDGFLPVTETLTGPLTGTVTRSYNNDFNLAGLSVNGSNISFAYDNDNLLTQAGSLSLARDSQNGFITGTTLSSTITSQSYNSFGEVNQFTASQGTTALLTVSYARDPLGRITHKTETTGGSTDTYGYTYDTAGRLTDVTKNGATLGTYAYDTNGNRLSKATNTGTVSGAYDDQDRLLTYGNNTYTYTTNGELQTKINGSQTTSYTYDALGNLTQATLPDGTNIEYVIDGRNRRIGKKVNSTLTQAFLYQDQLRPIAELDGSGDVVSRFVYGDKLNIPAYMIRNGTTYRIISDHLGSPRLVINTTNGNVEQRIDYDEFGNVTWDSNPGFQPFGFAGGLYDRDTRLTRFGARDYEAETGRWVAKDPLGFGGRDSNLYGYAFNDPINFIDPDGQIVINVVTGLIGAGVGAAVAAATGQSILAGAISGGISGFFPGGGVLMNAAVGVVSGLAGAATDPCAGLSDYVAGAAAGALGGVLGRNVGLANGLAAARGGIPNAVNRAFGAEAAGSAMISGGASAVAAGP